MELESWQAQLRKGTAELLVLALLAREGEQYGLALLQRLNRDGEVIADGALYPLLSRLEKSGRIAGRWVVGEGTTPRKYYAVTPEGRALADAMLTHWRDQTRAMHRLLDTTDGSPA